MTRPDLIPFATLADVEEWHGRVRDTRRRRAALDDDQAITIRTSDTEEEFIVVEDEDPAIQSASIAVISAFRDYLNTVEASLVRDIRAAGIEPEPDKPEAAS